VWWGPEGRRRTLALEGYRVGMLPVAEAQP